MIGWGRAGQEGAGPVPIHSPISAKWKTTRSGTKRRAFLIGPSHPGCTAVGTPDPSRGSIYSKLEENRGNHVTDHIIITIAHDEPQLSERYSTVQMS